MSSCRVAARVLVSSCLATVLISAPVSAQIDEVKSLVNHSDSLKNIITNSTLRHEKKGKDIIIVDNLANLIFTSNNENALAVPSDDRRFVLFRCSSIYKGDKAYFDGLGGFLDSPMIDRLFYQFLMQVGTHSLVSLSHVPPLFADTV